MGDYLEHSRLGRNGTDLPSVHAVQEATSRLVWKHWAGLSAGDQQDLAQLVLIKYFTEFGRTRLPDNEKGDPAVPIGWLTTVVKSTGVDQY